MHEYAIQYCYNPYCIFHFIFKSDTLPVEWYNFYVIFAVPFFVGLVLLPD